MKVTNREHCHFLPYRIQFFYPFIKQQKNICFWMCSQSTKCAVHVLYFHSFFFPVPYLHPFLPTRLGKWQASSHPSVTEGYSFQCHLSVLLSGLYVSFQVPILWFLGWLNSTLWCFCHTWRVTSYFSPRKSQWGQTIHCTDKWNFPWKNHPGKGPLPPRLGLDTIKHI